jgi:hypothetical protein
MKAAIPCVACTAMVACSYEVMIIGGGARHPHAPMRSTKRVIISQLASYYLFGIYNNGQQQWIVIRCYFSCDVVAL